MVVQGLGTGATYRLNDNPDLVDVDTTSEGDRHGESQIEETNRVAVTEDGVSCN